MPAGNGGFWTHQDPDGKLFGEKYGNINYCAGTVLWLYSAHLVRGEEPRRWRADPG